MHRLQSCSEACYRSLTGFRGLAWQGQARATRKLHHEQSRRAPPTVANRLRRLARASMDSPLVTQLFRQLFSHRAAQCLARGARPSLAGARVPQLQRRGKATRLGEGETSRESRWTPRKNAFPQERTEEFERYPMVTSDMLRSRRERPRRVRMLMRDFIEDSLYNPNYGYFSKQVVIFSPGDPFNFNAMKS